MQQRTVFPFASVNLGVVRLLVLGLSFCEDVGSLEIGVSDIGAGEMAGADEADKSRRHKGEGGAAGKTAEDEAGKRAGGDASGIAIEALRNVLRPAGPAGVMKCRRVTFW